MAMYKGIVRKLFLEMSSLKAQLRLKIDNLLFADYFENSKAVMLIVSISSKAILDANSKACEFYRYSKDEFLRKTVYDLQTLSPSEVDREMAKAVKLKSNLFEFTHKLANGEKRVVNIYASTIPYQGKKSIVVTVVDITEQRNHLEEAIRAKEDFESIFQAIGHPVFLLNPNHQIIRVNNAAAKLLALPQTDIEGKYCYELFHENATCPPSGCPFIKMTSNSSFQITEMEVETLNGYFLVSCTPVYDNNKKLKYGIHIATDITEAKRANDRLKKSNKLMQDMMDNSPSLIYMLDTKGVFIAVNKQFANLFNRDSNGIIGQKREEFLPGEIAQQHIENDALVLKARSPLTFEENNMEAHGLRTYFTIKFPLIDENNSIYGICGISTDVTDRKIAEKELVVAKEKAERAQKQLEEQKEGVELSNERLESLLRIAQFQANSNQELLDFALSEAIQITRSKVGFIYLYDEHKKMLSLSSWSTGVMHQGTETKPQPEYLLDKTGVWGDVIRNRKPLIVNICQDNTGGETPIGNAKLNRFLSIPVLYEDAIVAVIGVANKTNKYDSTDVRQLTLLMDSVWKVLERMILIDNLKKAKEKAEESDLLKTAFLQNMSHEIRTPLNAIVGFTNLLYANSMAEVKTKEYIAIVQGASNQLLGIVSDILTISALETKQESINIEPVVVNHVLTELNTIFIEQATRKGVSLYLTKSLLDDQSEVLTDKIKLVQILTNLINNALKFTHEGSVQFGYKLLNEQLVFFVKDTGIGIQKEFQNKIFERFRQADENIQVNYGGTGLGLSICKGFVTLLGGEIWVESEHLSGSTFYFSIPYKTLVTRTPKAAMLDKKKEPVAILIVDDEFFNHILISEVLKDYRVTLLHANNGEEAIRYCAENSNIALLFMDIKMPVLDGVSAATILREKYPNIKLVAQTAYALAHDIPQFKRYFDDYLVNPLDANAVVAIVEKYLKHTV